MLRPSRCCRRASRPDTAAAVPSLADVCFVGAVMGDATEAGARSRIRIPARVTATPRGVAMEATSIATLGAAATGCAAAATSIGATVRRMRCPLRRPGKLRLRRRRCLLRLPRRRDRHVPRRRGRSKPPCWTSWSTRDQASRAPRCERDEIVRLDIRGRHRAVAGLRMRAGNGASRERADAGQSSCRFT